MQNPYDERFLAAFEHLKERGIVTLQKEFSEAVGFPESYFNGLREGTRHATPHMIANLYTTYRVSIYYLLLDYGPIMDAERKGEPIKPGTPEEVVNWLEVERARVAILERFLQAKDTIVEAKEKALADKDKTIAEKEQEIAYLRALVAEMIKDRK